jgi:hypothetical protein
MNTLTKIDLQKFCWADEGREALKTPWHYKGCTYASDGRICIRIDEVYEGVGDATDDQITFAKRINAFFGREIEYRKRAALPKFEPHQNIACILCDGTGHLGNAKCPDCYSGFLRTGKIVGVGLGAFHPYYLGLVASLPSVKISTLKRLEMALFWFDGGRGAVMPTISDPGVVVTL